MKKTVARIGGIARNIEGRVGPPMLLWFLGVPGGICVLLWFFIWRNK